MAKLTDCERPFSIYPALKVELTINPQDDTLIKFAFSESGETLGKLVIPSNAIDLNNPSSYVSNLQILNRVQIYPVPDSILD